MSSTDEVRTVAISVRVPEGVTLTDRSVLRGRVEDSSIADRAADVVARVEQPVGAEVTGSDVRLQLEVPAGLIDERSSYSVFLHLDVSGNGEVEAGDALSTQTVPVLTHGATDEADVVLQRIG